MSIEVKNRRRDVPAWTRLAVLRRHHPEPTPNGRHPVACHWCGKEGGYIYWSKRPTQPIGYPSCTGLEWDHFIPLARGGSHDDPSNIVMACRRCNRSRCHRLASEWEGAR